MLSQTYLVFCLNVCMFCFCVVTNLPCVLFKRFFVLHLCCHKRTLCSVEMFARFAFVSSQTYLAFRLIVCMFCICVVTNVLSVLFKYFYVLHLCRHKRIMCSVEMSTSFAGSLSSVSLVVVRFACVVTIVLWAGFCLNVCLFCICIVINVWCMFCVCVVTNV